MNTDTAALIGQLPLFAGLGVPEARHLAEVLQESRVPAGEVLFREGEPGDRLYVILEGVVEVLKALDTPDERSLTTRGPGEFFGEMALLDPDGLRTATIRARSPARFLSLGREQFDVLLSRRPALALEMVRVLSLRLRDSGNATIADLRIKNQQLAEAYADLKAAQAQLIEKERLEQELRTAYRIQQSILPSELPRLTGFEFGARMMPARTVGGDLYDFIPLGKGRLGIAVGDVSDKGVPAAIFMALTRSLLRAEATRAVPPRRALERVNRLLLDMNEAGMFVTLLYGILDAQQCTFAYARAGHELPLVIDGAGPWLAQRGNGAPLGLFDNVALDEQVIALPPGTTMLLYTDGATDITDAGEVLFGMEKLQASASTAARASSAQALCDDIWRDLEAYRGATLQADDVALVAVRASRRGLE